jgi:hypothetical protein
MVNNWTYFIIDPETGNIKIGRSYNPQNRLSGIRVTHPGADILATLPDHSLERELHKRFQHLNVEGEWFSPGDDLIDFIEDLGRPDLTNIPEAHALKWLLLFGALLFFACFVMLALYLGEGRINPDYLWFAYFTEMVNVWGFLSLFWLYSL